jgi:amino acid transporter
MKHQSGAVAGFAPALPARLEPDAIGAAQDTVIGMATSAPAASVGLTLAALAAATAYGSGPVIILTAIPMLIIANSYRRLNLWNANCGASFEWVGRAISPYLGFLTGWLMIAGSVIGTASAAVVLGPSVLAVAGSGSAGTSANLVIDSAVILVMLVIAIIGIRITARVQVGMSVAEYVILLGFAVAGLAAVLTRHPGTFPVTRGWLSPGGIGGHGSLAAGFLIAMFAFTGWDGSLYVAEETKRRRTNPGRAAVLAVGLLAVIYTVSVTGLQGLVSPARLQARGPSALVYVAGALGGNGWAKVMALSLALSVIATTGTGIVLTARIVYGMASRRVLPTALANVDRRYATPVAASVAVGLVLLAITWVYLLATPLASAFNDVIAVTGLLYAAFYILTALAAIVYYRHRVLSSRRDAVVLGVLPVAAAGFLGWILARSLATAPRSQLWSLAVILGTGLILMLSARFIQRSPFFQIRRESDTPGSAL